MSLQLAERRMPNHDEQARPAKRIDERLVGRLRLRLLARASGSVLDVACGAGANFEYLPDHCQITAIDADPVAAASANRAALAMSRNVTVRTMDAHAMAFPDASFDTVVSSLAVCSYTDPVAALREMSRVCAPDGRILLLEHGRSSFRPWAWRQDRQENRRGPHSGCHQNREPLELVIQAGLRPVDSRRMYFGVIHSIEARPSGSPPRT